MTQACFPPAGGGPRGRGAKSNASGRFESFTRHDFDDGWNEPAEDDSPPQLKTELQQAIKDAHHPWARWCVHAATVCASVTGTLLLVNRPAPPNAPTSVPIPVAAPAIVQAPAPALPPSHAERVRARK